jgi:hypothetical protein
MLRAYAMEYPGSWDKNLQWAEFSYNNSNQESLKMASFEVLYERRCHTLLNWIEPGEKVIFGPDIVNEAEATVHRIQDNLKAAKSCQESYANKRYRPLEFEVGDHVHLKVSLMKGVKRFGMKEKLAPRYIGTFPILEKCGTVAYKLELPLLLAGVHDIFHVSQLKKCSKAPVDVVLPGVTVLKADLTYPEHSIKILDQKSHVCYEEQDDQVLQDSMEKPYCRRSNMGNRGLPPLSPSKFRGTIVREHATVRYPY